MSKSPNALATEEAFENLQVGDHFSEMASFHVFVVWRDENRIVTCSANAPCTFPEDGKWQIQTIDEFKKHYAYGIETVLCKYSIRLMQRGTEIAEWMEDAPEDIILQAKFPVEFEQKLAWSASENVPFGWLP